IADLNDIARLETHRLQLEQRPLDLVKLVAEAIERQKLIAEGHVINLYDHCPYPTVLADPVRMDQVISNLLGNAIKYSTPGTYIAVEVRHVDDEVRVLVTNHGPGIGADELPKIFDRYYRAAHARKTSLGGLGLGLYIAKGLILAHGGRIWAESTPGQTTTF